MYEKKVIKRSFKMTKRAVECHHSKAFYYLLYHCFVKRGKKPKKTHFNL